MISTPLFLKKTFTIKDLSVSSLAALSRTVFGMHRWIPMVSFSLDLWFGKGEIFFFHLTNLIIHILCTLAVLFLVFNLLQVQKERAAAAGIAPLFYAVWVAGLWALNPVQTNAVTYLVQRMASIQALFFITSVAFYVLGRRQPSESQEQWQGASLLPGMCIRCRRCFPVQRKLRHAASHAAGHRSLVLLP